MRAGNIASLVTYLGGWGPFTAVFVVIMKELTQLFWASKCLFGVRLCSCGLQLLDFSVSSSFPSHLLIILGPGHGSGSPSPPPPPHLPSPLKPGFDSMTARMGFMVNKVPLGQSLSPSVCGFTCRCHFTSVRIIIFLFIYHRRYILGN
jgi:hypothetical protein